MTVLTQPPPPPSDNPTNPDQSLTHAAAKSPGRPNKPNNNPEENPFHLTEHIYLQLLCGHQPELLARVSSLYKELYHQSLTFLIKSALNNQQYYLLLSLLTPIHHILGLTTRSAAASVQPSQQEGSESLETETDTSTEDDDDEDDEVDSMFSVMEVINKKKHLEQHNRNLNRRRARGSLSLPGISIITLITL